MLVVSNYYQIKQTRLFCFCVCVFFLVQGELCTSISTTSKFKMSVNRKREVAHTKRTTSTANEKSTERSKKKARRGNSVLRKFFDTEANLDGDGSDFDDDDHDDDDDDENESENEEMDEETKKFIVHDHEVEEHNDIHHSAIDMDDDHDETAEWASFAKRYDRENDPIIKVHEDEDAEDDAHDHDDDDDDDDKDEEDELFVPLSEKEKAAIVQTNAKKIEKPLIQKSLALHTIRLNKPQVVHKSTNTKEEEKKPDKKEGSANKQKKEESANKQKKEESANKRKKEESANKRKKEESANKRKKEEPDNKRKKEESDNKRKKEESDKKHKKEEKKEVEVNVKKSFLQSLKKPIAKPIARDLFEHHRKPTRDNVSLAISVLTKQIEWIGTPRKTSVDVKDNVRVFWSSFPLIQILFTTMFQRVLFLDFNTVSGKVNEDTSPVPSGITLSSSSSSSGTSSESSSSSNILPKSSTSETDLIVLICRQRGQYVVSWYFPASNTVEHWDPRGSIKSKSKCAATFHAIDLFIKHKFSTSFLPVAKLVVGDVSPWKQTRTHNAPVLSPSMIDDMDVLWCLMASYCRCNKKEDAWNILHKGPLTPTIAHSLLVSTIIQFCNLDADQQITKYLYFQPLLSSHIKFMKPSQTEVVIWPPPSSSSSSSSTATSLSAKHTAANTELLRVLLK